MSDDVNAQRLRRVEIAIFLTIAVLMAGDLAVDYAEGSGLTHVMAEFAIFCIAAAGALLVWRQLRETRRNLLAARDEARRWREENRELVQGLSTAIARQFRRWELSEAESDVGFFLLKGLSHKDIARLRQTSERTVREQSRAVYRKSGVQGRAELSAFFLENIIPPTTADD